MLLWGSYLLFDDFWWNSKMIYIYIIIYIYINGPDFGRIKAEKNKQIHLGSNE